MLFDRDRGILNQLSQLPAGSQIYITGHSQGAALATLDEIVPVLCQLWTVILGTR